MSNISDKSGIESVLVPCNISGYDSEFELRTAIIRDSGYSSFKTEKTIVFTPGFCRSFEDYERFLYRIFEGYSENIDRDKYYLTMFVPEIVGKNIPRKDSSGKSDSGRFPNRSNANNHILLKSFVAYMSPGNVVYIFHSSGPWASDNLGGKIETPEKVVMINPLLPAEHGIWGFQKAKNYIAKRECRGEFGEDAKIFAENEEVKKRYKETLLSNLYNTFLLVRDFCYLYMAGLYPSLPETDACLIFSGVKNGANNDDGMFQLQYEHIANFMESFRSFSHYEPRGDHFNVMHTPDSVAGPTLEFLLD